MSAELDPGRLLAHFGEPDLELLQEAVDTSPTLDAWHSVRPILADMEFVMTTMAAAYDAGVYSVERHYRGITAAQDLPIGAAIGDPQTGQFYPAFAQDRELNDPGFHAERMATDQIKEIGSSLDGLTLAVTVEPCPTCLKDLDAADIGISRVVYGATRAELEAIQILRPHPLKAPDIVRDGRTTDGRCPFEFFQLPNRSVQAASLELFRPFTRDLNTGEVSFDRSKYPSTRSAAYSHLTNDDRMPFELLPARPDTEARAIRDNFDLVLQRFYK